MGLLGFSYYANRPVYNNLDICCQTCCILTGYFCDRYSDSFKGLRSSKRPVSEIIRASYSVAAYFVLCCLTARIYLVCPYFMQKVENNNFSYDILRANVLAISEVVPEDTYAYGMGIDFLYQELGWTNQKYYRDFTDLYVGGDAVEKIILEDIKNEDRILLLAVGDLYDKVLEDNPDMTVESVIPIVGGIRFGTQPCYYITRSADH